jgi:hypothetical protein
MTRFLSVLTTLAILILAVEILPANGCTLWDGCVESSARSGGFGYLYDRATQTFYADDPTADGTETVGGVRMQLRYVVNCVGNSTDEPRRVSECSTAICSLPDGSAGVSYLVYQRPDAGADWTPRAGPVCRGVADPIPLADVEAEIVRIFEAHFKNVVEPEITVAPAVNAVVNLPVLASTPDPGPLGFDITNPLPGRVEATPAYEWTWSNGQQSTGAGVGYDGTSPSGNPGHYPVQTTFEDGGSGSVALTVVWSITLTVAGIPPITDIPPLEYSGSVDFPVRSARTVLVDSPN